MDWGPLAADKKTFGLYVCAAGKLAVYDISNLLESKFIMNYRKIKTIPTFNLFCLYKLSTNNIFFCSFTNMSLF